MDHRKVTLSYISTLLHDKLTHQHSILQIKQQVAQMYQQIKHTILNTLEKDEYELQTYLNKFNFTPSLSTSIDINLAS